MASDTTQSRERSAEYVKEMISCPFFGPIKVIKTPR